jgi:hypothetical protein
VGEQIDPGIDREGGAIQASPEQVGGDEQFTRPAEVQPLDLSLVWGVAQDFGETPLVAAVARRWHGGIR